MRTIVILLSSLLVLAIGCGKSNHFSNEPLNSVLCKIDGKEWRFDGIRLIDYDDQMVLEFTKQDLKEIFSIVFDIKSKLLIEVRHLIVGGKLWKKGTRA